MLEAADTQIIVKPDELLDEHGRPRPLPFRRQKASTLAAAYNLKMHGADAEFWTIQPLSKLRQGGFPRPLTYLASERFASGVANLQEAVVLTQKHLMDHIPASNCILLTDQDPKALIYSILMDAALKGHFAALFGYTSRTARIASSAVIHPNVFIADGAFVGDNSVILPNTFVGAGTVIKPNATIGGNGFETATIGGKKLIVEHCGGVWLADDVQIGSSTCVDKGLFGEFTFVGEETKVDNLVHVAHAAQIGKCCSIIACSEISGSVIMDDGVWLGPNASINQLLHIGAHTFIGTAATITRDLPAHALAFGSPAKVNGWVCDCRNKLTFVQDGDISNATCSHCGKRFIQSEQGIKRA